MSAFDQDLDHSVLDLFHRGNAILVMPVQIVDHLIRQLLCSGIVCHLSFILCHLGSGQKNSAGNFLRSKVDLSTVSFSDFCNHEDTPFTLWSCEKT